MKTVYTLAFQVEREDPMIFYVGTTNNFKRRQQEHRTNSINPQHSEYDTYKYQWIRSLEQLGIPYTMTQIVDVAETDEDSEYEWILRIARDNESKNIAFYENLPLTNMKAGDFLTEMLADKTIKTASDVARFRQERAERAVTYTRDPREQPELQTENARRIIGDLKLFEPEIKRTHKRNKTAPDCDWIKQDTQRLLKRELDEGNITEDFYQAEVERMQLKND